VTLCLAGIFVVGNVRSKKKYLQKFVGKEMEDSQITMKLSQLCNTHRGAHSEFLHNVPSCGQPNKKDGQFVVETC
jgi:hypothetical protein